MFLFSLSLRRFLGTSLLLFLVTVGGTTSLLTPRLVFISEEIVQFSMALLIKTVYSSSFVLFFVSDEIFLFIFYSLQVEFFYSNVLLYLGDTFSILFAPMVEPPQGVMLKKRLITASTYNFKLP